MPKNKPTPKKKEEALAMEGIVVESLKGKFRVQLVDDNADNSEEGEESEESKSNLPIVLAHLAGKLRKNFIKIVPGDRVQVEVSPYDLTRGRITYRMKG